MSSSADSPSMATAAAVDADADAAADAAAAVDADADADADAVTDGTILLKKRSKKDKQHRGMTVSPTSAAEAAAAAVTSNSNNIGSSSNTRQTRDKQEGLTDTGPVTSLLGMTTTEAAGNDGSNKHFSKAKEEEEGEEEGDCQVATTSTGSANNNANKAKAINTEHSPSTSTGPTTTTITHNDVQPQQEQQEEGGRRKQETTAVTNHNNTTAKNLIDTNNNDDDDSNDVILSISFNQDGSCLSIGTERGFRICNVHPYHETFRRTFRGGGLVTNKQSTNTTGGGGGGIGQVQMLFRCNLLALVGGGPSPQYPSNKVIIWDDYRSKPIGEISFTKSVLTVCMRRDRIVVALINRIFVYSLSTLRLLDGSIHTIPNNALGIVDISSDVSTCTVLACPCITKGVVRLELYDLRQSVLITAHESYLSALALSADGRIVCTASQRGTVVRVYDTRKCASSTANATSGAGASASAGSSSSSHAPLYELRRGVERATIQCLSISLDNCHVAVGSDRGTVHVFCIGDRQDDNDINGSGGGSSSNNGFDYTGHSNNSNHEKKRNSRSSLSSSSSSLVSSLVPKFARPFTIGEGEHSFSQIRGIEDPVKCAFVPDAPNILAVVGRDGALLLSDFSKGGEGERVAYHRFFRKQQGFKKMVPSAESGGRNAISSGWSSADADTIGHDSAVSDEMDGVVFGDEEQEDGFITIDNQLKSTSIGGSELSGETY